MRRSLLLAILFGVLAIAPAHAWRLRGDAGAADFEAFHRRFASAAYAYPRHGARPLGWTGFEVFGDASFDREFGDQPFAGGILEGDLPGDVLSIARVGARKGLPRGIDVGLSYGKALSSDLELVSGELQYALLKGGAVTPALSVRLTATQSRGSEVYDLDQYGLELLLSKGFPLLTPYVGAGWVRSEGTLERPTGSRLKDTDSRAIVYAGVEIRLLLPKLVVEVEQGEEVQGALRLLLRF